MSDLLQNLNPAQCDAVVKYEKPSLIVAGAGSGKTRVLTCRIAYMLQQGVAPHSILALTFTNKAAAEMRERIASLVGYARSRTLWMGTFHSIFARILRTEASYLGFPPTFTIYDTSDSRNVLKMIIKEMSLHDELYKPAPIHARISLAKNNLVTPEAYEANTQLISEDRERKVPELAEIYKRYAARCRENGAMDFDDLLLYINILFKDFPDVLGKYQTMFRYILVDEYQDTNYAQYIIVRRLAQHHANVCVVGDDAQSIYSFRGARIENILRFRSDFPDARIFKLEQNYRSTRTIVNAANSVIAKNRNQLKKESFSEGEEGVPIKVLKAYTDQEEATLIADELRGKTREEGFDWNDAAILYRTNMQSRVLEEVLRRRGIPYKIYGGLSFFQRKEIKDFLAYVRLVVNPRDDEAFRRIINFPARGIGDVTVGRMAEVAARRGTSLWEVAVNLPGEESGMHGGTIKKIEEFVKLIEGLSLLRPTEELYNIGLEIATRSGLLALYKHKNSPEAMSALDNLQEVLNSMRAFQNDREQEMREAASEVPMEHVTLEEWSQSISLLTDMDNEKPDEKNRVTLMTVHSAKGLEFRYVFIAGMEENLFPNLMGMEKPEGVEEERRLFYVALTRAKEAAVISFSESRFKWGNMEFCRPSRFLSEIDPQYLDIAFPLDNTAAGKESHPVSTFKQRFAERRAEAPRGEERDPPKRREPALPAGIQRPDIVLGSRFKSMGSRISPHNGEEEAAATVTQEGGYKAGMVVEHAKFGRGTITMVERISGDIKLTVNFREGPRTLLSKFARLQIKEE